MPALMNKTRRNKPSPQPVLIHRAIPSRVGMITLIICMCNILTAQTHFQPVPATGLPYTIIITGATLNGDPIDSGSEIAVFDDTLCVGATVFQDSFPVQITAWQASPAYGLAGFMTGNVMRFKIYTQNPVNEWVEIVTDADYETGNGTFGYGAFSVLSLVTTIVKIGENSNFPDDLRVSAYPNPFNQRVNFKITGLREGVFTVKIYTLSGQEVFSTRDRHSGRGNRYLAWHGQTDEGRNLPSGLYLCAVLSGNQQYNRRVILQK